MRLERNSIRRGLRIFYGLSIGSITIVFLFTRSHETLSALKHLQPLYLVLAVVAINGDWLTSGLRLYVLSRRITRRIPYTACVRASLANTFMGAITPSQTGGGPAQIYILYKEGLPVVESMSVSLVTFLTTVLFLVIAMGSLTLLPLNETLRNHTLRFLFKYGVTIFLVIGILVILFVWKPPLLRKSLTLFFNFLSRFRKEHFLRPGGRAHDVIDVVDRCHRLMVDYFRKGWLTVSLAVVITGLTFLVKFIVAYLIVRGLGVEAAFWEVVLIQVLITLAVYFCPTPGATGAAELGSAVLMASIVPVESLMIYVILWRAISAYIAVGLGSVVILRAIGKEAVSFEPESLVGEKRIALSSDER